MPNRDDIPAPAAVRRPYEPPRLAVYGQLGALTQAIGSKSMADGGTGGGMMRSQP